MKEKGKKAMADIGRMKTYNKAEYYAGQHRRMYVYGSAALQPETVPKQIEKPKKPKGNLAVPPFYCYRACDVKRIQEALDNGCGYDAPGSFAAWLSKQTPMHAYVMPGKRYDIGDINSYEYVKSVFSR